MKKLSPIALLLALAFASTAACTTKASDPPNAKAALAIGAAAPDFTLPDADGRAHSLASLKGQVGHAHPLRRDQVPGLERLQRAHAEAGRRLPRARR